MPTRNSTAKKVNPKALAMRRHRAKMRASGMKLVQLWVPDVNNKAFAETYRRQARALWDSPAEKADLDFIMAAQDWSE